MLSQEIRRWLWAIRLSYLHPNPLTLYTNKGLPMSILIYLGAVVSCENAGQYYAHEFDRGLLFYFQPLARLSMVLFCLGRYTMSTTESKCPVCNAAAPKRCQQCKSIWYCSRDHQVQHWKVRFVHTTYETT